MCCLVLVLSRVVVGEGVWDRVESDGLVLVCCSCRGGRLYEEGAGGSVLAMEVAGAGFI